MFANGANMPECTCKDWTRWHIPCKHFFAVFNHFPNWGWASLPTTYLENEYLTADSAVLTNPSDGVSHSTVSSSPAQGDLDGGETEKYIDDLPRHQVSIMTVLELLIYYA